MKQNFYCPSKAQTNKQTNKQTVVYSLLILCALLLGSNVMKAQITVATNGKVGLRTTTTSPTDDVLINGQTKITNGQCYLTLRGYYTTPQIYPYADNSGSVGISGNAFANI